MQTPANDLFSHPDTHDPVATTRAPSDDAPSHTNLFREPADDTAKPEQQS